MSIPKEITFVAENLCAAQRAAIIARLDGTAIATAVKTAEMERRLLQMNELRSEVLADRSQFVQKNVYDSDKNRDLDVARRVVILETGSAAAAADVERRLTMLNSLRAEVVESLLPHLG